DVLAVRRDDERRACGQSGREARRDEKVGVDDVGWGAAGGGSGAPGEPEVTELAAAAPVEHGELELVPALAERDLEPPDEGAELRIPRARIHLRDEQDPHGSNRDDSGTVPFPTRAAFGVRLKPSRGAGRARGYSGAREPKDAAKNPAGAKASVASSRTSRTPRATRRRSPRSCTPPAGPPASGRAGSRPPRPRRAAPFPTHAQPLPRRAPPALAPSAPAAGAPLRGRSAGARSARPLP